MIYRWKCRNRRSGVLILVLALVTGMILLTIASAIMLVGGSVSQPAAENRNRVQANNAVHSAVEEARYYLRDNAADSEYVSAGTAREFDELGNSCYAFWFSESEGNAVGDRVVLHVMSLSPRRSNPGCPWGVDTSGRQKVEGRFILQLENNAPASVIESEFISGQRSDTLARCPSLDPSQPGASNFPSDLQTVGCYFDEVMADEPALYWRLSDTGSTASDWSGNSEDGAINYHDSLPEPAPGAVRDGDESLLFGSNNGNVSRVLSSSPVSLGRVTAEAWIKWDGTSTSPMHIVSFANDSLTWINSPIEAIGISSTGSSAHLHGIPFPASEWANRWVHVAAVFDTAGIGESRLYINGRLQPITNITGTASTVNLGTEFRVSGSPIESNRPFHGEIDEVVLYPGALSGDRVKAHFDAR